MPERLSEAIEAACDRHRDVGFESLSEIDRILVVVWALEADVNNGGFHQYYFNSSGDTAQYAPTALRAVGAPIMGGIVENANSLFGPGGPPTSRDKRQQALFALTEELWDDLDRQFQLYPEDLSSLLEQFLAARQAPTLGS